MKKQVSVVGAIMLAASLSFLGCNDQNEREGIGRAPSEQSRGDPAGPRGPQNPERPDKTTEQTNR